MRLFLSGLRKLRRRPATWVTFGLLAGLLMLIILAVATQGRVGGGGGGGNVNPRVLITFPGAYDTILSFILGLGGLFAVIFAAAIAGSEWTWGTFKAGVARGESRSRYLLLSFAAIAVVTAFGLLATFALGILSAAGGATLAGIPLDGMADRATLERLPSQLVRGWIAIVETGAVGFAVATLARSQLAGIGVGIALYFGETFARIFLPDIVKYLPFDVATAAVGGGSGFGGGGGGQAAVAALPADTALLLVVAWLVAMLAIALISAERAEITG